MLVLPAKRTQAAGIRADDSPALISFTMLAADRPGMMQRDRLGLHRLV